MAEYTSIQQMSGQGLHALIEELSSDLDSLDLASLNYYHALLQEKERRGLAY